MSTFDKEPAVIIGLITAVITLLTAYGVAISDVQSAAITGLAVAIFAAVPVIQGFITRQKVVPVKVAEALISDAETKAVESRLE